MWDACDFGSYAAQVRLDRIRSSRVLRSFVHSGVRGARPFFFVCVSPSSLSLSFDRLCDLP